MSTREYSPETCKEDYGSEKNYNPDFPVDSYAREAIEQITKDASAFCRFMAMNMIARHKCDPSPETWKKHEIDLYNRYLVHADYYDHLSRDFKFIRTEEVP